MAKNDLDKYGVWVKTPPKTVDSEIENTNNDDFSLDDITSDLPDFNDTAIDTAPETESSEIEEISLDEFGMDDSGDEAPAVEEPVSDDSGSDEISFGDEEEISLDDFLDGGFSESKDAFEAGLAEVEEKVAAAQAAPQETKPADEFTIDDDSENPTVASSGEESVDLSDFGFEDESPAEESPALEETAPADDDDVPLDIDLSFDDDPAPASSDAPSNDITFDDIPMETSSEPNPNLQEGEEEIDLSDFGVDFSDDSSQGEVKEPEAPAASSSDNIEMSVMADDDIPIEKEEAPAETPAEEPPAASSSSSDDDFDVDALLDNIEDENGESTSLNEETEISFDDIAEPAAEEPSMEIPIDMPAMEEPLVEDLAIEEPIAEEPAVEDVAVEDIAAEPAFEDISVDDIAVEPEPTVEDIAIDDIATETEEEGGDFDDLASSIQTSAIEDNVEMIPVERKISDIADEIPEEPAVVENEPIDEIPDSFDEETNSILSEFEDSQEETPIETEIPVEAPASEENIMQEPTPAPAEQVSAPQNDATVAILSQIMGELKSLKTEINGLKDDLANLRVKETEETAAPDFESEIENPIDETAEESTGFFENDDGDDTIALSGDELNNILNTAEFETVEGTAEEDISTEEASEVATPVEENEEIVEETSAIYETDLSLESAIEPEPEMMLDEDMSVKVQEPNDIVLQDEITEEAVPEEPIFEDSEITLDDEEISSELPDEIMVPKDEDIMVEPESEFAESEAFADSSFEETAETEETAIESDGGFVAAEPEIESTSDFVATEPESEITFGEEPMFETEEPAVEDMAVEPAAEETAIEEPVSEPAIEEPSAEESGFEPVFEGNDSFDNVFEDSSDSDEELSIDDSLTDAKLDYLNADQNSPVNAGMDAGISNNLKDEIINVLTIMDSLLENLPDDKIEEFAKSEQFEAYKKLFKDLGLA